MSTNPRPRLFILSSFDNQLLLPPPQSFTILNEWSQHHCSCNKVSVGQSSSCIILPRPAPKISGANAIQPKTMRDTPVFEQRGAYDLLQQGERRHTSGSSGAPP